MRTGLVISGGAHAVVLLWCVVTFVIRPSHSDTPMEAVPIDVVSNSDLAKMAKGAPNAPPDEKPKPVADKVAPPTPVDDPLAKLANKEIKAATDVPPPPERKPPEPKPKKPPAAAQADPIADALKRDEEKKPEPKKTEVKPPPPTQPKKPAPESPAFDPRQVADLLNKRTPQRTEAGGSEGNTKVSFGGSAGGLTQNAQNELGALTTRLQQLWNPPQAVKDPQEVTVEVTIQFKPDGTLAAPPTVVTRGSSPLFLAAKESAIRAVYQGQPYTMLRPEHYEDWREVSIVFDPRYMTRF
jgi:outer membrane biosynthesis protein TonB